MHFYPKLAALAFLTAGALASFGAQAQTIDIKVTGTITPGACTPTLAGDGTFDYGQIDRSVVQQADFALLPEKQLAFTISCDVPSRVGLKVVDNRKSTIVPSALGKIGSPWVDRYAFGLGAADEKNIGAYNIRIPNQTFTADSVRARSIESSNNGTSWTVTGGALSTPAIMSWANATTVAPVAFERLSGNLVIQAVLNKGSELNVTDDVELDGSATLELVYL
jgi:hypothetical protein